MTAHPLRRSAPLLGLVLLATTAGAQLTAPATLPGDTSPAPLFGAQWEPHLAAGGGGYLAVWADERLALATTVELDPWEVVQSDVWGALLDAAGTPVGQPFQVDGAPYSQVSPRAASNGDGWLVAYESRSVSSTGFFTSQDVHAVRLSADGQVLDTTPLSIAADDNDAYVPVVGSDGTDYAVFWKGSAILGRKVFADGTLGPTVTVSTQGGWTFDPVVAFAGDRYLVVWEGGVQGRFLDRDLQPLGPQFQISSSGNDPEIATDGTDFYVTIADLGTWPEIRGTVVRHDGTVVSPNGVLLDGQSFLAHTPAPVAWDGSGYVVSWMEFRTVFPATEETLRHNRVDGDGVPQFTAPPALLSSTAFSVRDPTNASLGAGDALLGWLDSRFGTWGTSVGFSSLVGSGGSVAPAQPYMLAPPAQLWPDLVSGPAGTTLQDDVDLLVFVSADAAETRVVYQRLDGTGAAIDPEPVVLAGGSDRYTNPVAAWNGSEWLVAWEDRSGGTGNGGILALRLLPDGTVLDQQPIDVMDGNGPDVGALATPGGAFLVAASKLTSGDIRTVYGQRVLADGTLAAGPVFLGVNYAVAPTVEGFDDRWLVAWYRRPTHDTPSSTLQARFVLGDGSVQPLLDPTNSTADELLPDLSIAGDVATLAWSDGTDIRVRQITKAGTPLGSPAGVVVSAAPNEQTAPTVCADGGKIAVTWVDDRIHGTFEPGVGDLFGARLDTALAVLEPAGLALAADPRSPEGEAALTGRMGVSVVVIPAILPETGNWRLTVGAWRDFADLGGGTPGTAGVPRLMGVGTLSAGTALSVDLERSMPGALLLLWLSASSSPLPALGGTVHAFPFSTEILLAADGSGHLAGSTPFPPGILAGTELWLQFLCQDPTSPWGITLSNGVRGTTP